MKDHKMKIGMVGAIVVIAILLLGIYFYVDGKKKQYEVEEVSSFLYYPIYESGKMGVIDTKGNKLIEPIYDNVKIPNPQRAVFVCQDADKTVIQNDKKETLFSEYEEVTQIDTKGIVNNIPYEKRVLRYKQNGKYGLIDYEGNVITKPIYEEIEGLENKESELLVKKDGKYGVINQKGARIIKPEYDGIVADGYYEEEYQYALSGYVVSQKTRRRIPLWLYECQRKKSIRGELQFYLPYSRIKRFRKCIYHRNQKWTSRSCKKRKSSNQSCLSKDRI